MQRPSRYPRRRLAAVGVTAVIAVVASLAVALAAHAVRQPPGAGAMVSPTPPTSPARTLPEATPSSNPASTPDPTPTATATPTVTADPSTATPTPTAVGIDLAAHSTTDPASIWVVVNKQHPIDPLDYEPADLVAVDGARVRQVMQADLEAMLAAAEADGVRMGLRTGFRSYGSQAAIRADVEARRGYAHAEKYSARPGYSEHQTGLSFDLHGTSQPACDLQTCFADTAEGGWVAAHAAEYGFLVRYTPENTGVTGFSAEAWHLRYVGRELSTWMRDNGIGSLEEVLGVTGGPDYPA